MRKKAQFKDILQEIKSLADSAKALGGIAPQDILNSVSNAGANTPEMVASIFAGIGKSMNDAMGSFTNFNENLAEAINKSQGEATGEANKIQNNLLNNNVALPSGQQANGQQAVIPINDAGQLANVPGNEQLANTASSKTRKRKMASNTFNLQTHKKAQFGGIEQPPVADTSTVTPEVVPETQSDSFQLDEFTEDNPPQTDQLSQDMGQLKDGNELKLWLDSQDQRVARDVVLQKVTDKDNAADLLSGFYEIADTENAKLEFATELWKILPDDVKVDSSAIEDDVIEAPLVEADAHLIRLVKETEEKIKKLAQSNISPKRKEFNLKKSAQAKTTENMIMYMPNDKSTLHPQRIDPFLRQPINDWHVVERNKGFGLVLDDYWNVDWESIWRGNIMDKYSRPYRDTKTGEWVGGYIQKRFEVDKWIPEENNYQLLPGQRRKPRLPEYGIIEGRLEEMRKAEAKKRGYGPVSEGESFNWKEAQAKKKR